VVSVRGLPVSWCGSQSRRSLNAFQAAVLAAERSQSTTKVTSTDAVDDKVQRRIGGHNEVAEVEIVEISVAALVVGLGKKIIQQLVDVSRSLRYQEDNDDNKHHQSDVVALSTIIAVQRRRRRDTT